MSLRVRGSWDLQSQGFYSVKTHVSASPGILGLAEPRVLFSKNPCLCESGDPGTCRAKGFFDKNPCLCESGDPGTCRAMAFKKKSLTSKRNRWGTCRAKGARTLGSASPGILGLAEQWVQALFLTCRVEGAGTLDSASQNPLGTHCSASPRILGLAEPRVLAPLALRVLTFSRKTLNLAVDFKILCFCESGRVSLRVRARVSASPGACLCKSGRMSLRVRARVSASPGTCQCQSEAVSSSLLSVIVIEHEN